MRQRLTRVAAIAAAWLPLLVLWLATMKLYGNIDVLDALPRAALTIGSAALLGIPVFHFCARTPWQLSARFFAKHFVASILYSGSWVAALYAIDQVLGGKPSWRVAGYQFNMGLWFYAIVAGVSCAITTQRRAHENELRAIRAEAGLATARLDALRSRLHPHFLFNALHTVTGLVRHEPAQAENAIEKLGDMLRYTLHDQRGETVPFAEEWEFTRRYLDFEQLRYGERLNVDAAIDPACMTCTSPSFALQTLVENAVRHSIATRPEGGRIEISARTGEDRLHVRVRDDGRGERPSTHNGSQYGLASLRERLHVIYGSAAELDVASKPDGFEVTFTIPCSRSADADDE